MKIQNNKTKTYLVVGLSLVAMLASSSSLGAVFAQVAQPVQTASILDTIPSDKLLAMPTLSLALPNSNQINQVTKNTQDYMNYYKNDNGIGGTSAKAHAVTYNFDAITRNPGHESEIVALYVAKQKLTNAYNPTEPVKKYHDWLLAKYPTSKTVAEIDAQIDKIIGGPQYRKLVPQLVDSYNTLAQFGNVPEELYNSNPNFWDMQSFIASCEFTHCDQSIMKTAQYTQHLTSQQLKDTQQSPMTLTPSTLSVTNVNHVLSGYVDGGYSGTTCGSFTQTLPCKYYLPVKSGIGFLESSVDSGVAHAYSPIFYISTTSCPQLTTDTTSVFATPSVGGNPLWGDQTHGNVGHGCVTYQTTVDSGRGSGANYEFGLKGQSPSAYR